MVVAWLLFPLVMLVVCTGCGFAVEWAAGYELPGTIIVSVGLCLIVFVSLFASTNETSAPLAMPVTLVLAAAGYVLRWRRAISMRPEGWPLAVGIAIFCVCAAPVVLTGNATFLGYFVLNDGVFHFSLTTQLLSHGHDLSSLPLSAYSALLHEYLSTAYPTGADLPLGVLRPLVGQDLAWIFQPYMAVIMALGATAVYELLREVIDSRPLRALSAFVAGQAGLLYAYYLEASIKEIATVWLITLTVVLVFTTMRHLRLRGVIPLLLVTWAGIDVLSLAIAPWLAPPLAAFLLAAAWQLRHAVLRVRRSRLIGGAVATVVVVGGVGALLIHRAETFLTVAQDVLTQAGDLGNLVAPLSKWEIFGIWPVGDFRFPVVNDARLTYALIGVEVASLCIGLAWAVRRRKLPPLLLFTGVTIAVIYLLGRANPYAAAKVEMIGSLTAVASAMLGPAALLDSGHRVEAWALAAVLCGGVLWTTALGYHDASVAPRARLQELATIDHRFKGDGPAFYDLSDEYAAYFLRDLAPTDVALGQPAARSAAATPAPRQPWDPDDLSLPVIESFRLIVIGNAALASRPPANYHLAYQGRYYDV
ncbi:MAG: hypothetical protein ACRDL5_04670, partial [Solirubrobacteraceae bacterium]